MTKEFIITSVKHESCGPQRAPVAWATMRCYQIQRVPTGNKDEDDMSAFDGFSIPTCNFGSDVLPVGTRVRIEMVPPDGQAA